MKPKSEELSYREFNQLVAKRASSHPTDDSPGDSAEDAMTETWIGKDDLLDDPDEEEPEVLADHPAELGDDVVEVVDERVAVVSSERPDPIADLDRNSSTH